MKKIRIQVYDKFNGKCAYSGTDLQADWQIDHKEPKRNGGDNSIDNLLPAQKIINHYKRALSLEQFRILWLGGLHKRLPKLPKNPRTANGQKRKNYLLTIAELFNISAENPFNGKFYFERTLE
jgi:5-methylcytosine-specific restriction endonuclease McrA